MTVTDLKYKPFLLSDSERQSDWVTNPELHSAFESGLEENPIKVLILYGSLRTTSYSRLLALEFARILDKLGADVRIFDPTGLRVKDDASHNHPKVQELRDLSTFSQAQIWSCPEQHGAITAVSQNQIDWIPFSIGSVRPTQGRTLAFAQVSGGSQSFNTVNTLRLLGR